MTILVNRGHEIAVFFQLLGFTGSSLSHRSAQGMKIFTIGEENSGGTAGVKDQGSGARAAPPSGTRGEIGENEPLDHLIGDRHRIARKTEGVAFGDCPRFKQLNLMENSLCYGVETLSCGTAAMVSMALATRASVSFLTTYTSDSVTRRVLPGFITRDWHSR